MGAEGGWRKAIADAYSERFGTGRKQNTVEKARADISTANKSLEELDRQRKSLEATVKRATAVIEGHDARQKEGRLHKLDGALGKAMETLKRGLFEAGFNPGQPGDIDALMKYIQQERGTLKTEAGEARARQKALESEAADLDALARNIGAPEEKAQAA